MRIASIPLNEKLRLQDLNSFDILDTQAEKEFDELAELAASLVGCQAAAISFIDSKRQWFKARKGLDATETARDVSFCSHTILEDELLIVTDALQDERFSDNPEVVGGMMIRFYAGAPIVSSSGYKLGAVCILDRQPRKIDKTQARSLKMIARQVSKLLELRLKNKLLKRSAEHLLQVEKKLLQQTLQEQEKERRMIGRELHENIAQGLAATKLYLEMAEANANPVFIRKSIENVTSMLNQTRDLSKSITPSTLETLGLNELLEHLVNRFASTTGIKSELVYSGQTVIHPEISITLYRMVEEQLSNIQQHAQAAKVIVSVKAGEEVSVSVQDNGVGFELAQFRKGFGIGKIVSLAEYFGGTVNIVAHINAGCNLTIRMPAMTA
ncbi:MAG TPA: GAF domain-containing protein [Flavisolibacter sp.]|nr:GAF domain-containing protein [Flavisolibacter sp.]